MMSCWLITIYSFLYLFIYTFIYLFVPVFIHAFNYLFILKLFSVLHSYIIMGTENIFSISATNTSWGWGTVVLSKVRESVFFLTPKITRHRTEWSFSVDAIWPRARGNKSSSSLSRQIDYQNPPGNPLSPSCSRVCSHTTRDDFKCALTFL